MGHALGPHQVEQNVALVLAALTDEWSTTTQLAERTELSATSVRTAVAFGVARGQIDWQHGPSYRYRLRSQPAE